MALNDFLTDRGRRFAKERRSRFEPGPVDHCDEGYQKLVADFVLNGMYARDVFPQATRELIAVACLTALYRPDLLRSHVVTALSLNSEEQVREAILQAGVYGGFPCVISALRIFGEAISDAPG
jgi:4-carboxymuconolactone decarboxylase